MKDLTCNVLSYPAILIRYSAKLKPTKAVPEIGKQVENCVMQRGETGSRSKLKPCLFAGSTPGVAMAVKVIL